ncbi:hypothetical protein EBZ80_21090 [bacterium]|nr:hypothetical protein [bacterium]
MATLLLGADPVKEGVWKAFADHFQNPLLFFSPKDSEQDAEHWVYVCRIHSLLLNENRFLIVMVRRPSIQNDPATPRHLRDLPWHILQTRHVENPDKYRFLQTTHRYDGTASRACQQPIERIESTREWTRYACATLPPLAIFLLHQRKTVDEYANRGSVRLALETYRTIVELRDTDYSDCTVSARATVPSHYSIL